MWIVHEDVLAICIGRRYRSGTEVDTKRRYAEGKYSSCQRTSTESPRVINFNILGYESERVTWWRFTIMNTLWHTLVAIILTLQSLDHDTNFISHRYASVLAQCSICSKHATAMEEPAWLLREPSACSPTPAHANGPIHSMNSVLNICVRVRSKKMKLAFPVYMGWRRDMITKYMSCSKTLSPLSPFLSFFLLRFFFTRPPWHRNAEAPLFTSLMLIKIHYGKLTEWEVPLFREWVDLININS